MVRVSLGKRRQNVTLSVPAACVLLLFNRSDRLSSECTPAHQRAFPYQELDLLSNTEMGSDLVQDSLRALAAQGYPPPRPFRGRSNELRRLLVQEGAVWAVSTQPTLAKAPARRIARK